MKTVISGLVVLVGVCGAGYWILRARPSQISKIEAVSVIEINPFAALEGLKTFDGRAVDSEALKGKTVVLNFWASWCPPCLQEMPSLLKLVNRHKDSAVLVAISADDTVTQLKKFLTLFPLSKSLNVFVVHDSTREIMRAYGITKLPETLFFNQQHKKTVQLSGSTNFDDPVLDKLFQRQEN